jgi:hypothetical protein
MHKTHFHIAVRRRNSQIDSFATPFYDTMRMRYVVAGSDQTGRSTDCPFPGSHLSDRAQRTVREHFQKTLAGPRPIRCM